jgi:hypothetical protein
MGTQVIVPFRDEDDKRHLKLTGDLGQIVPMVTTSPSALAPQDLVDLAGGAFLSFAGMGYSERGADRAMLETF